MPGFAIGHCNDRWESQGCSWRRSTLNVFGLKPSPKKWLFGLLSSRVFKRKSLLTVPNPLDQRRWLWIFCIKPSGEMCSCCLLASRVFKLQLLAAVPVTVIQRRWLWIFCIKTANQRNCFSVLVFACISERKNIARSSSSCYQIRDLLMPSYLNRC